LDRASPRADSFQPLSLQSLDESVALAVAECPDRSESRRLKRCRGSTRAFISAIRFAAAEQRADAGLSASFEREETSTGSEDSAALGEQTFSRIARE
jgi:hypothetical protein